MEYRLLSLKEKLKDGLNVRDIPELLDKGTIKSLMRAGYICSIIKDSKKKELTLD